MKKFLLPVLALALLMPASALAATMHAGEEVRLSSQDTITGNYYAAGGLVAVSGNVDGDAYVAGGMINVTGSVRDDLVASGGNLIITGTVGQDLRAVGGNLVINGRVEGELVAAGGTVQLLGSEINGDASIAGGLVSIDGTVNGNLKVAGGQVEINGTVNGNVEVQADEKLLIGESANVHGTIMYRGRKEAEIADGAQLANAIQFEKIEAGKARKSAEKETVIKAVLGILTVAFLLKIVITIVTAFIFLGIFPKCAKSVVEGSFKEYWRSTLYGFVIFIMAPIITIVLLVTVIGSLAGVAVGLTFGLLVILAKIIAAIMTGVWAMNLFRKKKDTKLDWKPVVIGGILFNLLLLIPIVGWVVMALIFLSAFGSLSLHSYETIVKKQ